MSEVGPDILVSAAPSPADTDMEQVCEHWPSARRLRLLSYNIQTGIAARGYRHYLMHSWKHVLPDSRRLENLNQIAMLIREFDVIGLQEVDGGSLRSGFINQTEYLARRANFPHWYDQTNRNLGLIGQHSISFLSRLQPTEIVEHRLPGRIPGRGTLSVNFGNGENRLMLFIVHFALGRRARLEQIRYVGTLLQQRPHTVLMGDLNFRSDGAEMELLLKLSGLREPVHGMYTFPSWRPNRNIDHILVSPSIEIENVRTLNCRFSDHLPIAMDVVVPKVCQAAMVT